MATNIKPREITRNEIDEILSIKRSDITATKLKSLFAAKDFDTEARFQPNDTFTLLPNKLYNSSSIKTTVGRYIINLFCIPITYLKKYGYLNEVLDDSGLGNLEKKMGKMILEDEMTTKEYAEYMDHTEWLAMNMSYYIVPSLSKNLVLPIPEVMKRKNELFDQYKQELDAGDLTASNNIEKELITLAKKDIEALDDPSYDLYKSGVFSFNNAYKKCSIMVGSINNPQTNKIDVVKSNYTNGISKEDYDKTAALTIIGGTGRGVVTQKYGYETKKYNAALQSVAVDIDDSNIECGTTKYLSIVIPDKMKTMFYYRFIIDGSSLVELTPENIDKYVGKEVKLRSPMYCKSDDICQHCAGTLYKRMGLKNVGLVASNATGSLLNASMKKMHDSTVKINKIDIEKYIIER